MNIATRIAQLERRVRFLSKYEPFPHTMETTFRLVDACYLKNQCLGQIQALKWVEAERKREMKELGELLKEMGRRNLKRTKHT